MKIHRSTPDESFTALPNAAIQDARLSHAARGVLADLLSRPDGSDITADALSQMVVQQRTHRHKGTGRVAIREAFAELEEHGYLVRIRTKGKAGRFVATLDVYDTPGHQPPEGSDVDHRHKRYAYVYRHWDEEGRLLYVGVTQRPRNREWAHAKSSRWMGLMANTTVERYPSRAAAEAAESTAIASEQPLFNVAGNEGSEAQERVRAYLSLRGRMDLMPLKTTLPLTSSGPCG